MPLPALLLLLLTLSAATVGAGVCHGLKQHGNLAYQCCDQCVQTCLTRRQDRVRSHRGRRHSEEHEDECAVSSDGPLGERALCPFRLERRPYGDITVEVARRTGDGGDCCRRLGLACTELTIEIAYRLNGRPQRDAVPVGYVCAAASASDSTSAVTETSLVGRRRRGDHRRPDRAPRRHRHATPGH